MIKLVFCIRRKPVLTPDEFHAYWRQRHAPLVQDLAAVLHIRRYVQNHAFTAPALAAVATIRNSSVLPYDGVAELWWDSVADARAAGATPEGREAGRRLLEDERQFIDLAASPLFFVEEQRIL